jgi:hypothetical protein
VAEQKTGDSSAGASDAARPARPGLARDLPDDPELDVLVAAFEAGDFGRVRALAKQLNASSKDDAVKRAAEVVLARTKADPLQTTLLLISALLLVLLSGWWVVHSGKG